jgi:hypothetical protein
MPKPDKATVGNFGMGKDLPGRSLPMPVALTTRERGGGGAPAGQPPPAPPRWKEARPTAQGRNRCTCLLGPARPSLQKQNSDRIREHSWCKVTGLGCEATLGPKPSRTFRSRSASRPASTSVNLQRGPRGAGSPPLPRRP